MSHHQHAHFHKRTAAEHVKHIKNKHAVCKGEPHTTGTGFLYSALSNSAIFIFLLFLFKTLTYYIPYLSNYYWRISLTNFFSMLFFRACGQARNAWSYMELCHRSIKEEKEEVDANYDHETEELREIFASKGFKDPILEAMTEYVSSDSKLMLEVMVREELNIDLGEFPHPLSQAFSVLLGAGIGFVLYFPLTRLAYPQTFVGVLGIISILSAIKAKMIGNRLTDEIIWSNAIVATGIGVAHSILKLLA